MRTRVACLTAVLLAGLALHTGRAQSDHEVTRAEYDRWKTELSNWGRWGADDEIGTLNLITPAKRREAAALVRDGVSVSLSLDLDTEPAVDNGSPFVQEIYGLGGDGWHIRYHGYGMTHIDALAHVFDDGATYNGYVPDEAEVLANGHPRSSIHNLKHGIVTRGVLMDIPRLKGVDYLEPGTAIYPEDLEAWERQAGFRVSAGDAMFVRTGRWVRRARMGPWPIAEQAAGLHVSCLPWLRERDVALLGGESPQDVEPMVGGPGVQYALHNFLIIRLGMHLFDNVDLTALSETAAELDRWEFMLTVAPLAVRGGTGSAVNPIATF